MGGIDKSFSAVLFAHVALVLICETDFRHFLCEKNNGLHLKTWGIICPFVLGSVSFIPDF